MGPAWFAERLRGWWEDVRAAFWLLALSAVAALVVAWMLRYPPQNPV